MKKLDRLALLERRREEIERRRTIRLDATAILEVGLAAIDREIVRLGRNLRDRLYPVVGSLPRSGARG